MILAKIENINTSHSLLASAAYLAEKLRKELGIAYFQKIETKELESKLPNSDDIKIFTKKDEQDSLLGFCEANEVSFLIIQQENLSRKAIQKTLNDCRNLRIPYLLFRNDFSALEIKKVMIPVGFLVEELEKAQFGSAFGRFCGAEITILQANDYGSKAQTTVNKMATLFDKFDFPFTIQKAEKDSFKVDKEAVEKAEKENYDISIISASREYGLDDIIFGPTELHLVKNSSVPVLLINPRDDLYTLCD